MVGNFITSDLERKTHCVADSRLAFPFANGRQQGKVGKRARRAQEQEAVEIYARCRDKGGVERRKLIQSQE
jgi:hypothetical protein